MKQTYAVLIALACAALFMGVWLATFPSAPMVFGTIPLGMVVCTITMGLMLRGNHA